MSHRDVISAIEKTLMTARTRLVALTSQTYLSSYDERRVEKIRKEIARLEDKLSLETRQIPLLDEEV